MPGLPDVTIGDRRIPVMWPSSFAARYALAAAATRGGDPIMVSMAALGMCWPTRGRLRMLAAQGEDVSGVPALRHPFEPGEDIPRFGARVLDELEGAGLDPNELVTAGAALVDPLALSAVVREREGSPVGIEEAATERADFTGPRAVAAT